MTSPRHAITLRAARQAVASDVDAERHWAGSECWCGQVHEAGRAGLVPPPWSAEREGD